MSLRDEVVSSLRTQGPKCRIPILADQLGKTDGAELLELVADPDVPGTALSAAIVARGLRLTVDNIRNHRRGTCSCAQAERLAATVRGKR